MDTYGSTAEKFPLILPATNEQQRNLECRQLTEPPEFMTTVREMRARLVVLHSANSSHNTGADIDKSLLKRWRRDNTKIYGNQVVGEVFLCLYLHLHGILIVVFFLFK